MTCRKIYGFLSRTNWNLKFIPWYLLTSFAFGWNVTRNSICCCSCVSVVVLLMSKKFHFSPIYFDKFKVICHYSNSLWVSTYTVRCAAYDAYNYIFACNALLLFSFTKSEKTSISRKNCYTRHLKPAHRFQCVIIVLFIAMLVNNIVCAQKMPHSKCFGLHFQRHSLGVFCLYALRCAVAHCKRPHTMCVAICIGHVRT